MVWPDIARRSWGYGLALVGALGVTELDPFLLLILAVACAILAAIIWPLVRAGRFVVKCLIDAVAG